MPVLMWDKLGDRVYSAGVDRGVLYLPDGTAIPWNGLTSVTEKFDESINPIYHDGIKIQDATVLGSFSGSLKAYTYPVEFDSFIGMDGSRRGMAFGDQILQTFGLSYRNRIGNDLDDNAGYKIHLIYNLTAISADKSYTTDSDNPDTSELEWNISAVPEEIPGFRPSAHFVFDTTNSDPWFIEDLEDLLYGRVSPIATLPSISDMLAFINDWYRVKIYDNGNGTWTAISKRDEFIEILDPTSGLFQITKVNAKYLDDNTFEISDTTDVSQTPDIRIIDNGDGTWTAMSDVPDAINMLNPTTFQINGAEVTYFNTDLYSISDTPMVE